MRPQDLPRWYERALRHKSDEWTEWVPKEMLAQLDEYAARLEAALAQAGAHSMREDE